MTTVTGTAGADLLHGTSGNDTLLGLAGDDTLLTGTGADSIDGGDGTDRASIDRSGETAAISFFMLAPALVSQVAGSSLTGVESLSFTAGSGHDGLVGGAGDDSLDAASGHDALQGLGGADSLAGGDGADTLLGGAGADLLIGGGGADRFILQGSGGLDGSLAAPDRIQDFNAAEGDRLILRGEAIGTGLFALATRSFALSGQASRPVGFGGTLAPRAALAGGLGLVDATGGAGLTLYWQPDLASGGWVLLDLDRDGLLGSADLVVRLDLAEGQAITAESFVAGTFATLGTTGVDALAGTAAADSILGFGGADSLAGLDGDDTLAGGEGADSLGGGAGFDSLLGGAGADTLYGGDTTDVLDGGSGDDGLLGGAGNDLLLGGDGADRLQGQDGDDSLQGGFGADTLDGGAGADTLLLQGMGQAAWSSLAAPDIVIGFSRAEGDRLKISNAWFGNAGGSGADAGTYTGADGIARALLFSGSTGAPIAAPTLGMVLPAQWLGQGAPDAYQLHWLPAQAGGGWMVLDLDRNGRLDTTDLLVRLDGLATLAPEDFVAGTFLTLTGGFVISGTAGGDSLAGGSLAETFLASPGSDRIAGGAGAGNALSYAGLAGPVAVAITGYAAGTTIKPDGGTDSFSGIQILAGTSGADTLDASAATGGFFALSLEGRAGADRITGNGTAGVQVSYASSPGAISLDLLGGGGLDGWGSTDTLVGIHRIAAVSAFGDTVWGTFGDEVFISGAAGNKTFDGRAGIDEWRYAGDGALTVMLASTTVGGYLQGAYVLKPGGTDRLTGIEVVTAGAGNDRITGSAANERLGGGAGNDTLDGAGGLDIADYGNGGLATRGVVVNLATRTATDQWGGTDVLRNIESAWGSSLGDDLTGVSVSGTQTWLRGLSGNDTLRAPTTGSLVGADYAGDPGGIVATLGTSTGTVRDGWGGTDTLVRIALLRGSAFADRVTGSAGADTLLGGAGDDTLDGAAGTDRLEGGQGDDSYVVGAAADVVVEAAAEGSDTVTAAIDWALPEHVEALVLAAAAGNISGTGNELDNLLAGNAGANALAGGLGQDTLRGGDGADTLQGGLGDDLLEGEAQADHLLGGSGADTLRGGDGDDSFTADADGLFTGTLLLDTGDASTHEILLADAATFADVIEAGAGTDRWFTTAMGVLLDLRLLATPGLEELNGSAGNDALLLGAQQSAALVYGAAGHDTLSGTAANDWLDGGEGDDLLAGQDGADTLAAGSGADTLFGGAGHDRLEGGAGADRLHGGQGDDVFLLDHAGDLVSEHAGEGADTVIAAVSHHLAAEVEALVLAGEAGDILGIGNGLANTLTGNAGANLLLGQDGDDTIHGGAGRDTLYGGAGDDSLAGGAGADHLAGGDGADRLSGGDDADVLHGEAGHDSLDGGAGTDFLSGGEGHDRLDGGPGPDHLFGGAGDDTYLVDSAADMVFETAGGGTDTVLADIAGAGYCLPGGIEELVLLGITAFGMGNALDNRITGNPAANWLLGGDGNDTLDGGAGADVLFGGAGADAFIFGRGAGQDSIGDFTGGTDTIRFAGPGSFAAMLAATTDQDGAAVIDLGQGDALVLRGVAKAALLAGDFLFG